MAWRSRRWQAQKAGTAGSFSSTSEGGGPMMAPLAVKRRRPRRAVFSFRHIIVR